jgi:hypothetical protein
MNNMPVCGSISEIYYHPDVIIIIIITLRFGAVIFHKVTACVAKEYTRVVIFLISTKFVLEPGLVVPFSTCE